MVDGSVTAADLAPGTLLSGPRGPRGEQGPKGETGPRGLSNVKLWQREGDAPLPLQDGGGVTVITAQLPAGLWLVEASSRVEYWPSSGPSGAWYTCRLLIGDKPGALDTGFMGNVTGGSHSDRLAASQRVQLAEQTTLRWQCWHSGAMPASSDAKARLSTLEATLVEKIDVQDVTG